MDDPTDESLWRPLWVQQKAMDDDIARSRECGFFAHLTKPVDIRVLEDAIAAAPAPAVAS